MGRFDCYKDEDLNFGRLLVLMPESKETVATIKRCIGSKYAESVGDEAYKSALHARLYVDICDAMKIKNGLWNDQYRIYRVDDNSLSTFATLGLDGFVTAMELKAQDYEKLHNAVRIYACIEEITHRIEEVATFHRGFLSELGRDNNLSQIDGYTASIETLEETYGRDLQSRALADINEILASRW